MVGAYWLVHAKRALPAEVAARHAFAHLTIVVAGAAAALVIARAMPAWRRAATIAVAIVALGDVYAASRADLQPKPGDWASGTDRFAAVDWLIAQHPSDRFAPAKDGPFRLHSAGDTYDLDGAGGYGSGPVWRFVNFLYVLDHGIPYPHDHLKDDLSAGWITNWSSPLVDLMNVRWAIAPDAPPGWIERFRPKPGEPPHARHEALWDSRLRVYENPHPMPRAFVVYSAVIVPDEKEQAKKLATLDPRKQVIVDRSPKPAPIGDSRDFTPATIVEAARQHLRIEADAAAPGVLVTSETDYPGWRVTVDGKPAEILHADYAFRGVALDAGHHVVDFTYVAAPTRRGLALSAAGFLALAALAWPLRRRRDRIA